MNQFDEPLRNEPALWIGAFPFPAEQGHKYDRGHALAVSGPMSRTGAARLAARAALRAGAGLVTLASPPDALAVNARQLTAVMLLRMDGAEGLSKILADPRIVAIVLGPALGVARATAELVRIALQPSGATRRAVVLDADAITSFEGEADKLARLIAKSAGPVILTPHEGEYMRLTGTAHVADRVGAARSLSAKLGAVVVLKGARTVIAAPDGRTAINSNAPPTLATAGSGDVLAGIACGLLAQGMPGFEAACAAVWMHGEAAALFGPGLISEDIEAQLPRVLRSLGGLREHPPVET
jgi:ADP-dependent NAD(P)H-hydrate dehydratase / NAD(P)H-hydrate epimerase